MPFTTCIYLHCALRLRSPSIFPSLAPSGSSSSPTRGFIVPHPANARTFSGVRPCVLRPCVRQLRTGAVLLVQGAEAPVPPPEHPQLRVHGIDRTPLRSLRTIALSGRRCTDADGRSSQSSPSLPWHRPAWWRDLDGHPSVDPARDSPASEPEAVVATLAGLGDGVDNLSHLTDRRGSRISVPPRSA